MDNGHDYDWDEMRCVRCDCRPWGRWAELPCGTNATTTSPPNPLSVEEFTARAIIWTEAMK